MLVKLFSKTSNACKLLCKIHSSDNCTRTGSFCTECVLGTFTLITCAHKRLKFLHRAFLPSSPGKAMTANCCMN